MRQFFLNDKIILSIIVINAIIIFISGFQLPANILWTLSLLDQSITVLFIVEIFVKINAFGVKSYFSSGWNLLDFTVTLIAIPALVAFIFDMDGQIQFILVLRVLRAFKSFRLLKFIPDIDGLLKGVRRALRASLIIVISIIIYLFTTSILSYHFFHQSSPDFFGNPMMSLYCIFKVFTIEGWNEIPESITADYSATQTLFTYGYFVFILLTGGIFGISLVNSVFVDAMVSDNNDELERKVDELHDKINQLLRNNNIQG